VCEAFVDEEAGAASVEGDCLTHCEGHVCSLEMRSLVRYSLRVQQK